MAACTDNLECPPNELCYTGVPWFEEGNYATAAPDTLPGCYCNTFYGFTGPTCVEASTSTMVTIVWNALSFTLGMVVLIILAVAAFKLHRREKLWSSLAMFTTILLAFVGATMTSLWALMVALSAAVREGLPPPHWDFKDQYKGRYNAPSLVFGPLGVGISALALLHVSLTWIEIAINSGRLTPHQSSRLVATKKYVYLFEVTAIAVGVTGTVYEKSSGRSILGFLLIPLIIGILVSYVVGAILLRRLLHQASGARRQLNTFSSPSSGDAVAVSAPAPAVGPPSFMEDSEPAEGSGSSSTRASWFWASLPGRPKSLKPKALSVSMEGGRARSSTKVSKASSRAPTTSSERIFIAAMIKVRNTVLVILGSLVLFFVATVGISSVDQASDAGWKALATPETFPFIKVFHHMQMTAILVSLLSVALYVFPSGPGSS